VFDLSLFQSNDLILHFMRNKASPMPTSPPTRADHALCVAIGANLISVSISIPSSKKKSKSSRVKLPSTNVDKILAVKNTDEVLVECMVTEEGSFVSQQQIHKRFP